MKIKGCTYEIMKKIRNIFTSYWSIDIQLSDDNLYDIYISSDIPFILKYNAPVVKIDIGGYIIDFSIEDTVAIELM